LTVFLSEIVKGGVEFHRGYKTRTSLGLDLNIYV